MTTFDQLVAKVRSQLLGYTADQQQMSELSASMGPTDTSFTVDTATAGNLSRGLVEIDDELILVKTKDAGTGILTVLGLTNGRGREGTTAASHAANALVTMSPKVPRLRIKDAINDTIRSIYPRLPILAATEITKLAPVYEYAMPVEATDIWYLSIQQVGPTKVWMQGRDFKFNPQANTTDFPSGKSIQVFDGVTPGRAIRVVYTKPPATLAADSDDFTAVSGYPERITDLIVFGATGRLLPGWESARLQAQTIEATERATLVQPSSASRTSQYFLSLFEQRLEEERSRLFLESPNMAFFQGS
jgi:hypothetical protein